MTGLLISVRSAAEAEVALAGGADLIDVKEPRRGSLGAAEPGVWQEVLRTVAGRAPTSVALGELLGDELLGDWRPERLQHAAGACYAKVGLAGCAARNDWQAHWREAMAQLPTGVRPVAAAYVDCAAARSPPVDDVLALAAEARSPYLLLDTFDKSAGNLFARAPLSVLAALGQRAARNGVQLVLAGSLDNGAIRRLAPLVPAYFAVRGAACSGARTQAIELARVKRLAEVVRTSVRSSMEKVA